MRCKPVRQIQVCLTDYTKKYGNFQGFVKFDFAKCSSDDVAVRDRAYCAARHTSLREIPSAR